jgi:hypothetical protein
MVSVRKAELKGSIKWLPEAVRGLNNDDDGERIKRPFQR